MPYRKDECRQGISWYVPYSAPLLCPRCGAELRLIAFVTAAEPVARILTDLDEPAQPPRIDPARGPPAWDDLLAPLPDWDTLAQPAPEFQFDQRISW